MGINLVKGQRVEVGLKRAVVGLGWDPSQKPGVEFDLDASAFLLAGNNKVPAEDFFVFYNNPQSPDGGVRTTGDDRSGGNSDGDDESLELDLLRVDSRVDQIVFVASIHEADKRRQNFGQVRNAFIRIYNPETSEEICKYELNEDFSVETCVEFGRLYRRNGAWRFEALGDGHQGGITAAVNKYC